MLTLLLPLILAQAPPAKPTTPEAKWGTKIEAIEAKLKANPPKEGGTFFAGSSTIVLWNLNKSFLEKNYTNVGFGGSKIAECTHFAPRILLPYKPGTIVFHAGGNDLAAGESAEKVAEDFKTFVDTVRKASPSCRVLFISIKPTIKREGMIEKENKLNALIKEICQNGEKLTFVDVCSELVGSDGKPKREMLKDDLLHPSDQGYEVLTAKVQAALAK